MRKHTRFYLLVISLLCLNLQAIRYVKVTATGTGDGSSWVNAAGLSGIQAQILADSAAIAGTTTLGEVRFAAGKYNLTSTITLNSGVNLTGGWAADGSGLRDSWNTPTILDGGGGRRLLQSSETKTPFSKITTVDGFILQRGASAYGSAVAMNAGVVLQNCIIRNNTGGDYGAAIFVKKNTTGASVSGALINCLIVNNTANNNVASSVHINAGGIYVADASPFSMINCVVANNECFDANTTTVANYGVGGLYISGTTSSMANCQLVNNIFYNNSGNVANNVKVTNTLAMPNIFNNWFGDAVNPFVNTTNTALSLSTKANQTATNIATPGFSAPSTFMGSQLVNADTTAIYSAGWALSSNSALIDKGISKDVIYPYILVGGTTNRLFSSITNDIMGNLRLIGTLPDMGVGEYTPVTITTVNSNAAAGTITPTASVAKGGLTTVTAVPKPGFGFLNWTNSTTLAVLSTAPSYTFTANATVSLTANYNTITAFTMPTPLFARTATTIDLVWKAPAFKGSMTYKVVDGTTGAIIKTGITGLSTTLSKLNPNSTYSYKVIAMSGTLESVASAVVSSTTRKTNGPNYELIDNFEATALSGWGAINGSTCTYAVVNPNKTGINTSLKCAQLSLILNGDNDAGYYNSKERIDLGPHAPYRYLHLKFKRNIETGGLALNFPYRTDTTLAVSSPTITINYSTKMVDGIWYEYVFDLQSATSTDQVHFGFTVKPNYTTYPTALASVSNIDDIFLSNDANPLNATLSTIAISVASNNATMGSVSGGGACLKSQLTTVNASVIAPYHFLDWTENGVQVSITPTYTFTPTVARNLVANFQSLYLVSSTSNNATKGTVTVGGSYNLGTAVSLTATVKAGYKFVNWTENDTVVTTNPVYAFTVKSDRRLIANFITPILINALPNNTLYGTVSGSGTHDLGEVMTLKATSNNGYVFSNWTENGIAVSKSLSYRFTVSTGRSLVANFIAISPDVANYNYCLGTQTIGAKYSFTADDPLVETAKGMAAMGTNMIKVHLDLSYGGNAYADFPALLTTNAAYKQVFDMPFSKYFCWVGSSPSADAYPEADRYRDSMQMFNLTKYLLTTYNNSGKTYYLGNWEGDWLLLRQDAAYVPSDGRIQAFIKWARTRQNAVDAAKALFAHSNVEVFYYLEVNRCVDARDKGLPRLINLVIPYTNIDYVSYSSYDVQNLPQLDYNAMLDYVESKLPPKPSISGKRVFIGECGRNYKEASNNGVVHESLNSAIFVKALIWGCPFVLYWEFYNNEIDAVTGLPNGFWLITDKNVKTPLYYTFSDLYQAGKQWVNDYKLKYGSLPTMNDYQAWAVCQLAPTPTYFIQSAVNNPNLGSVNGTGAYELGAAVTVAATPKTGCRFVAWNDGSVDVSTTPSYSFNASTDLSLTAVFSDVVTSEKKTETALIRVKKNPVQSNLVLLGDDIHEVIILDGMGQQVLKGKYSDGIEVGSLAAGVYSGKVMSGNNQMTNIRFIKQ